MTVKELTEALRLYPPDIEVRISGNCSEPHESDGTYAGDLDLGIDSVVDLENRIVLECNSYS